MPYPKFKLVVLALLAIDVFKLEEHKQP